ncbi:MAG: tRNA (N(6)-L-threonylcarbamoyladenosine(37)-C(2))-methylthiotransferase MtaB, partial [Clostridiaceae bacterium]|nr:tRNA (N(6)-L-threonylcarbamoyladenosine(37)-C(2))-methylthiotransferase MtaB [Clostridiaceae bacterium]
NSIELLRSNIRDVAVTTDVMVGFPGETDDEFESTYRFIDKLSFSGVHVFKYSPRKGTPAADFLDQASSEKKEERSNRLLELGSVKTLEFNRKYIGRSLPVLFEQPFKAKEGFVEGLTPNYIRVACRGGVEFEGQEIKVLIKEAVDDYTIGTIEAR